MEIEEIELIKQFNYDFLSASRFKLDFPINMQIDDDTHNAIMKLLKEYQRLMVYDNIENQKYLYGNIEENYIPKSVIREKINKRQSELVQELKTFKDDIRLNTLQEIYYEGEEK